MTDNVDNLLELAFKAEKFGDRVEAIRLYRQVASTDSGNARYASNCADELEKLGVPDAAILPDARPSSVAKQASSSTNPFRAPTAESMPNLVGDAKYKIISRVQFTSGILYCLAVFCFLAAAGNLMSLSCHLSDDWPYPVDFTWCVFEFLMMVDLLWVTWACGSHARALGRLLPLKEPKLEAFTKTQLGLWIGVGILAGLTFARGDVSLVFVCWPVILIDCFKCDGSWEVCVKVA